MEQATKVIEAISHLLGAIAWPIVTLVIAFKFGPALRDVLKNLSEGRFKGMGLDITIVRENAEVSLSQAQEQRAAKSQIENQAIEVTTADSADALTEAVQLITPSVVNNSRDKLILWVDDRPDVNVNERRTLRTIGYKIWKTTSTDKVLKYLNDGNHVDIIISDMARPEGDRAGFNLLKLCKEKIPATPFIIYTGSFKKDLRDEAISLGAVGFTSDPSRLIRLIIRTTG